MHHIKLKVPSFAPFVTGIIDNIKMTVHKYHNVWVSHRMNYEPRKLMDVKHSCVNGFICDDDIGVIVGFKFTGNHAAHYVFSPVMSFRSWLRPYASVDKNYDPEYVLDFWFENKMVDFKCYFDAVLQHVISGAIYRSEFIIRRRLSRPSMTTYITDDTTVTTPQ